MLTLKGRKVLVGICGSIAAYKAAYLVRLLKLNGAEVRVIMTPSALSFITPLTLSTLSENPVYSQFVEDTESGVWNNHVALGAWADVFLIAPASENTIGKMANGICDNLLLATYFSSKCPVIVCPAMDLDMYQHPTTKDNLSRLQSFSNQVIEATYGSLASGFIGQGRLAEPEDILRHVLAFFNQKAFLLHKKIVITTGPTVEPLDPVRFVSNHSSGKMGAALAHQAYLAGAEVKIVSGPVESLVFSTYTEVAEVYPVTTALDMLHQVEALHSWADIIVFAAAVADYSPKSVAAEKIKKSDSNTILELVKNPDIAAHCGAKKKPNQHFIGFALETAFSESVILNKLHSKKLDMIVANIFNSENPVFGSDQNEVRLYTTQHASLSFSKQSKDEIAKHIWETYGKWYL